MFEFLRRKAASRDPQQQQAAAERGSLGERRALARDTGTRKEILYYLAQHDPDPKVRLAVVNNASLPLQASEVLARDSDVNVRLALARRLIHLLPELSADQQSQLYSFAVQALGNLALDEVLKIRLALSSTLQDHAHAPPKVVGQLARDVERSVAEPILRFCAAVPDEDLIEILKESKNPWVVSAVAGRSPLAALVSGAVIGTRDLPGGTILLGNAGAVVDEATLQLVVDMARGTAGWQTPLANHVKLPATMVRALAEFADDSVRDILMGRKDFDAETVADITATFKRRLDFAAEQAAHAGEKPVKRVVREAKQGELDNEKIADALAMRDYDFVYAALALAAKTSPDSVKRVVDLHAPKPIIALCWAAGLPMRFALAMQQGPGQVQPADLIYPKDGFDYPLSEEEMNWQLKFLEIRPGD